MKKKHEVATTKAGRTHGTGATFRTRRSAAKEADFWGGAFAAAGTGRTASVVPAGSVPADSAAHRRRMVRGGR